LGGVKGLVLAVVIAGSAGLAHAQSAVPVRAEVPVREVVLSDGTRRYGVPITVGASEIIAGLDTGSTGLRILPNVLKDGDARPTGRGGSYSFAVGTRLDGVAADASVSVGALSGKTTVQLVQRVGCRAERPGCAAGALPLTQYGVQGNGLPGEGFKAILGVNMAGADVASLFSGIGARRWIVDLPRPGEAKPGRIVLNPTDAEVQGFVSLPLLFPDRRGDVHDAVAGCLVNDTTHERLCGGVVLDTGAPGLRVVARDIGEEPWPKATPATLVLADASGRVRVAETLVIGQGDQASDLTFEARDRVQTPMVFTGVTAYFAYSILYDPAHGVVGFRPRQPTPSGPSPMAVN